MEKYRFDVLSLYKMYSRDKYLTNPYKGHSKVCKEGVTIFDKKE